MLQKLCDEVASTQLCVYVVHNSGIGDEQLHACLQCVSTRTGALRSCEFGDRARRPVGDMAHSECKEELIADSPKQSVGWQLIGAAERMDEHRCRC